MNDNVQTQSDNEIDYQMPKLGTKRWILIAGFCFVFGILSSFPIFLTLENTAKKALSAIPGCSISFKDINFHFFLPKIVMTDIVVPSGCYSQPGGTPIELKDLRLNFRGISFAPFGPHFKLETELLKNPINAYLTVGLLSNAINIKDNKIDLEKLTPLIPTIKLKGVVDLNALVEFSPSKISELKLALISKNLVLPSQSILGFTLPVLNFGDFLVKGKMDEKSVLTVDDLIIGNSESPIRSSFKGKINVNTRMLNMSRLDLKGEASFSEKLLSDIPLIEMAMQRFTKKDRFYQIAITGQMSSPTVKSP